MMRRAGWIAAAFTLALGIAAAWGELDLAPAAVPTPGAPEAGPIAVVGGTVHPVDGPDVPNGTVVFDHGKITAVGPKDAVTVPAGATVVDATGKQVYPSLIDPWSTLGLTEIDANRAQHDYAESAPVAPNVRADQAFQAESDLLPVTRANGVLLANVTPRGGVLSGQAALMELDGWTNADMTVKAPLGLVVNWPNMLLVRGDGTPPESVQRDNRQRALDALARTFDEAAAYATAKQAAQKAGGVPPPHDARWEAMLPELAGRLPVFVQAEEVHQIEDAVAFADARHLKLVLYGGYDAAMVAPLLVTKNVPVILSVVDRLPRRRSDPYDAPFTLAGQLVAAGVKVAIANGGGAWNERNLPYQAARASAFGLGADAALRAITLAPAEIVGAADRVGSLTVGKDATLFVADGDILDEATHVERAWVEGRAVDLDDRQKTLDRKYREKFRRLGLLPAAAPGRDTTPPR
jgi:imidazolonepropionase-like amidohydrolase